ncbi:acetyltransferase [Tistrella mobilis]|uniref:GCN5-related N-acetyltransferase n=1 Tax=Tistrella mobilis (strain KA081020-065) TaxID=1110502 RepID=I3TIL9_TISMK|nr:acetyltransferase [Tistrella mobilis]AFK52607.1 GCN5-related N-acetyltransferase [Tistrella mobilis KA081020-065]
MATEFDGRVRDGRGDDLPVLLSIWERSVRATHDFLTGADIRDLVPVVRDQALPSVRLLIAADADGRIAGFLGLDGNRVEMLFVDPDHFGCGVGRALIEAAAALAGPRLDLDVNEQNPGARGFYAALGFIETGRSPLDGQGRAFPLIHLRRS